MCVSLKEAAPCRPLVPTLSTGAAVQWATPLALEGYPWLRSRKTGVGVRGHDFPEKCSASQTVQSL